MNLFNFGRDALQKGMLNNMLEQVGVSNVDDFVKDFRNQASQEAGKPNKAESDEENEEENENENENEEENENEDEEDETTPRGASSQPANMFSMGTSFLNQFTGGGGGGNNSADMIQGAMKAYQMFSGGKGGSGGGASGGGGFLDNISSSYQNAQKMYALYKQFDKNGDGKITEEDIKIYLQEMGLGFVSPFMATALFQAVDQNHNGTLDFTDLMALVTLLNKLSSQFGGPQNMG